MSLSRYKAMRKFEKTTEPEGSELQTSGALRFVVQLHAASRTHYDFRIEMGGTFRSWAVPKGPSLDPLERRLAVKVEDHPLEYGSFEGVIPKGNYGAGTVMIWDEGTLVSRETEEREAGEKALLDGLARGHITFVVNGTKLKGEFALIKLAKGDDNAWLLVKKSDGFARRTEITNEDRSARSGRTLGEIAKDGEQNRIYAQEPAPAPKPLKKRRFSKTKAVIWLKAAPPDHNIPRRLVPAKTTPAPAAFARDGWIFERFWDGYRAIVDAAPGRVQLTSRLGTPFKNKFATVETALAGVKDRTILDGIIVAVDAEGRPRHKGVAAAGSSPGGVQHIFFAIDLLHLDGRNLRDLPLAQRKEILGAFLSENEHIKVNDYLENDGFTFMAAMSGDPCKAMLARACEAPYPTSARDPSWLAIPCNGATEARPSDAWRGEFLADLVTKQTDAPAVKRPKNPKTSKPRMPTLSNQTKVYWPEDGITKGDMLAYYQRVAPLMIPHLVDRPQSLNRYPHGIHGESFFQKEMAGHLPSWAETVNVTSSHGGKTVTYVLCQNVETLLYLANLGCIEINAWNSRADTIECPDYVVIDIDPNDAPFSSVITVTLAVRALLDEIGAQGYVKTSGSRGLHVFVPLEPHYNHDQVRAFAELFSRCIHLRLPALTSIERSPDRRIGRVYLDYLQNRRGQTMAAIYSLRPKLKAPVSTPLHWHEVRDGLDPSAFNLRTIFARLDKVGDLWAGLLQGSTDLQACFARLRTHLERLAPRK